MLQINNAVAEQIRSGLSGSFTTAAQQAARTVAAARIPPITDAMREAAREAGAAMRAAWERGMPANLLPLDDETIYRALDVSRSSGPCVIWAPRAEIVEQLVAGNSFADRASVLVNHRQEVLDDLSSVLDGLSIAKEARDMHDLAAAAVAAAADGHDLAAQALAGSAVGCLVHTVFGHSHFGDARKKMSARDVDDALLIQVRFFTLELATANALIHTDLAPEGFNRHGTLHGDLTWYGEAEMLSGLLLVVGWDRELSWWGENEPDAFGVDA